MRLFLPTFRHLGSKVKVKIICGPTPNSLLFSFWHFLPVFPTFVFSQVVFILLYGEFYILTF